MNKDSNCYKILDKSIDDLLAQKGSIYELTNEDVIKEYTKNLKIELIKHFSTMLNFNPFLAGTCAGVISGFFNE